MPEWLYGPQAERAGLPVSRAHVTVALSHETVLAGKLLVYRGRGKYSREGRHPCGHLACVRPAAKGATF